MHIHDVHSPLFIHHEASGGLHAHIHTHTHTHTHTNIRTNKHTNKETNKQTARTHTHTHAYTYTYTYKHTNKQTHKQRNERTNKQKKQTDRQTNKLTNKQTNKQTNKYAQCATPSLMLGRKPGTQKVEFLKTHRNYRQGEMGMYSAGGRWANFRSAFGANALFWASPFHQGNDNDGMGAGGGSGRSPEGWPLTRGEGNL
jgi:hypothetical protein